MENTIFINPNSEVNEGKVQLSYSNVIDTVMDGKTPVCAKGSTYINIELPAEVLISADEEAAKKIVVDYFTTQGLKVFNTKWGIYM